MTHDHVAQALRDADAARSQLEHTLDELRERFTPGRMLDEALDYSRDGNVSQFVRNFGDQVKHNPLPIALVGAGLAWLMLGRGGSNHHAPADIEARYRVSGDDLSSLDPDAHEPSIKDKASQAASQAANTAGAAFASAADTAAGTYERATRTASDIAGGVSRGASRMSHRAADMRRKTSEGASRMVEDHPLVLGVLGLALGAVLGSALPGTKMEDQLAGDASEKIKRQARDEVSEQAEKAMDVAERAYDDAINEGQQAASKAGWKSSTTDAERSPDVQYSSS